MTSERNNLLKLIFPNGYPSDWDYSVHFNDYISKVGTYKLEDLAKEPARLKEEKSAVLEQTQELAVTNYKTFIQAADCSRELFNQFSSVETKLDSLLVNIPTFEERCQQFVQETSGINNLRRLNSLTLTRNAQMLEILELPQLMDSFIKDGLYEDALELAAYVKKLYNKHPDILIFKGMVTDVEKSWSVMLNQLLNQLRQDLALPKCLQIVSHLRHMEVFTETELRLKFLQTRNTWLQKCLDSIAKDDATYHLNKTIEVTRVNLFNIITQYKAIFNDDEHSPFATVKSQSVNQNVIFFSWIKDKISQFLDTLETDLNKGVNSIDSILGQCMYFGLSFSRVGCDFRPLMIPIITKRVATTYQHSVLRATKNFETNIESYTLINKSHAGMTWKSKVEDENQPPESLLEFYPLAEYLNNILSAFNELRLCAPLAITKNIVASLQESLTVLAKAIVVFYGQEQQAFSSTSKDAFTRLCICFADDLVPFVQKCVHVIFPPNIIAAHIGVSVQNLQKDGISFLNRIAIVEPIKHLLPMKIEPVFESVSIEKQNENCASEDKCEEKQDTDVTVNVIEPLQ